MEAVTEGIPSALNDRSQRSVCLFLLRPSNSSSSPLRELLYSKPLSVHELRYDWCRLPGVCVSVDRVVLDTELKIGVGCDYNALYSTWCYLSITWEKTLRAPFILRVWEVLPNALRYAVCSLSRGEGDLINLFDARLVSSFASTLPDFSAGNRKFKINHRL